MILLKLPVPPSSNHLFANIPGKGRVKTSAYRGWIKEAGWALQSQRHEEVAGPVKVSIAVRRTSGRADIDNRIKALLDLLVRHRVIGDDRMVEELYIRWSAESDDAEVLVESFVPTAFHPEVAA